MLNGAFRDALLVPNLGERLAYATSSLMLATAIVILTSLLIGWIAPLRMVDAWSVGAFWLAMTLAFEFLAGHYLFGKPWAALLADYNVAQGRIWIVVPIATLLAPALLHRDGQYRPRSGEFSAAAGPRHAQR
jgi:hypothetical protein